MAGKSEPDREDSEDWRYAVDEVGEDGSENGNYRLEPGSPDAENVFFVVVGVVLTVLVIARGLGVL